MTIAKTLDAAARTVGVNFIGGYSALVSKGMTTCDELLIRSIPEALASTEFVCSSVNVGSTKTGINMDAVRLMERSSRRRRSGRRTMIPWDAPNWWCSATRRMTTPLWRGLSTG